ncbi:hypothetical protein VMT65_30980 [Nocardia sp. CDC153]|nr:hypothetical protein [Nocardia sp. CDC153]MEC3957493.1 hypothetical protein [Nocardia sp. CDC153]
MVNSVAEGEWAARMADPRGPGGHDPAEQASGKAGPWRREVCR